GYFFVREADRDCLVTGSPHGHHVHFPGRLAVVSRNRSRFSFVGTAAPSPLLVVASRVHDETFLALDRARPEDVVHFPEGHARLDPQVIIPGDQRIAGPRDTRARGGI